MSQELIWHYTDSAGLIGILQSGALWATSAFHLNDAQEVNYPRDLYLPEVGTFLNSDDHRDLAPSLGWYLESGATFLDMTPFVSCFCEADNLLSQWRCYGKGGGFAVGLDLHYYWQSVQVGWNPLVRVVYMEDQQRARIGSFLQDVAITWRAASESSRPNDPGSVIPAFYVRAMHLLMSLKHPSFSEEREVRFLQFEDVLRSNDANTLWAAPPKRVKWRPGQVGPTPYVDADFRDETGPLETLPIREIVVGPTAESEVVRLSVEALAKSYGYDAKVRLSGAPLRSTS